MINLQDIVKNIQKTQKFSGDILFLEPMKNHTTFKVGGSAQVFAIPNNTDSLLSLMQELTKHNSNFFLLGGGSNIVVSDKGIDGVVIATEKINTIELFHEQNAPLILRCDAGCSIESVIAFCIENELSGFENFAGLPGTVGGALYMNARCYDKSISDVLLNARYCSVTDAQAIKNYVMNKIDWDYKKSPFQKNMCILQADFQVTKGKKSTIRTACTQYIEDRKGKGHFSHPSAGSVFKNNRDFGQPSGKIIDSVGLKGYTVGGAQIAPWHGNLIINLGDASADNIKEIVEQVQNTVYQKTGKKLECEVLFVGNFQ